MGGETTDNNVVTISGKVLTELKYSHEIYGEGFYHFLLEVPRLSDSSDSVSVTVSERLVGVRELIPGANVTIEGQFRSYNSFGESGSRLLLTVFARELSFAGAEGHIRNSNKIFLNGFICKKPIYRSTPFGREITDLLIAVNRAYNKSDYIPCISWGRNARFCASLGIGENIRVWGRIQSRTYQKKQTDGSSVARVAYEVSLSKLETADTKKHDREEAASPCDSDGEYQARQERQALPIAQEPRGINAQQDRQMREIPDETTGQAINAVTG
jgi:single-stranded DNA-binding protein